MRLRASLAFIYPSNEGRLSPLLAKIRELPNLVMKMGGKSKDVGNYTENMIL